MGVYQRHRWPSRTGLYPNTARNWKNTVLEKGPDIFAEGSVVAQYERRMAKLEQLVGKKEVEIALSKGFLGSGR